MTRYSPILSSFNGGELSPRMMGRVDQAIYQISAKEMLNFVPTVEGPAMKRTGFRHIRAALASSAWLSSFIYSDTQAYVIEWGEGALRFFTNGGRIETAPNVAYEVAVPYTAAQAPLVSQQQSYDRLYLSHPAHAPAALTRTAATAFSYGAVTLKGGPFADTNTDKSKTVTFAGGWEVGDSVTVTANSAIFEAGHVGASFLIEAEDFSAINAWEPGIDGIDVGDRVRSDGKAYEATAVLAQNRTGQIQPTHSSGEEWDGQGGLDVNNNGPFGVKWKYLHDRFGVGTIASFISPTQVTLTVTRALPVSTGSASYKWAHGAISAARGWPKINLLAFGRLIYFTDFEIIASVVGDYGGGTVNMSPYTEGGLLAPDQAFRRRLAISNPVLWAVADRNVILIGTSDGTYAIGKVNSNEAFSSDNIECIKQGHWGAAPVWPVQTGVSTIYAQRAARKLREAGYALDSDRYTSPNIVIWQRHILKGRVRQLAFQADPEEMLWAVRGDGQLALHPHVPEQDVRGFARAAHAGGSVLSAVAIPNDADSEELWVLVQGAGGAKSVELQAAPWEEEESALADAFYVDSGASYDGAPTTTVSGLTHLAGRSVAVLADGAVVPGCSVDGAGNLTPALPRAASKIHVGLGYQARLTWLRPELRDGAGRTVQAKKKRLVSIFLRVLETLGVKLDPGTGTADELIHRRGGAPMDAPIAPLTGDTEHSTGGSWDRDGQGTIISDDPLPCMIVAAMPSFEVSEK